MTITELARLVRAMRGAQRQYFRTRSSADLEHSKAMERQLDATVAEILEPPGLFGTEAEADNAGLGSRY